jgi:hypothetical protein
LELWLEDNERALPRRFVVTYRSLPGRPIFIAELSDWDFSIQPPDSDFVFQPPAGVTLVGSKASPTTATPLPYVGPRATSQLVVPDHTRTSIAGHIPTFTVAPIPIMEPVLSRQVLSPALLLVPQQPPHTATPITRSPIIRLPVDRHIPRTRPPAQTPIEMIVVSAEP